GAIIGTQAVQTAKPDGYTLLMADVGPLAINPTLYRKLPYDPQKDFAPIGQIAFVPFLLVVHPGVPARTVGELIDLARREPGKLNMASVGNGSASHVSGELFK